MSEILKEKCAPSKYAPEAGLSERDSLNYGAKEVEVKKKIKDKSYKFVEMFFKSPGEYL